MKNKDKILDFLIFIGICLIITITILNRNLNNLDEIWNYNFARNIYNGLVPYRDFNMIMMPSLALFCGLILKLTVNELIVMRFLAGLICGTIVFIIYKLLKSFKVNKIFSAFFVLCVILKIKNLFWLDYNWTTLLIVSSIITFELKLYEKLNTNKKIYIKDNLFLGVLAGLSITVKHTTGMFIALILLLNGLIFVKNKNDLKFYLKNAIYRTIGICIPVFLLLIYLVVNNAIGDCINYTILGIGEFNNYTSYKSLIRPNIYGLLAIIAPVSFVIGAYKHFYKRNISQDYFIFVYGIANFVIAFPISDRTHFVIGAIPILVWFVINIYNIIKKIKILNSKKLLGIIGFLCLNFVILLNLIFTGCDLLNYLRISYADINHFNLIPLKEVSCNRIKKIDDFIIKSDKKVVILDSDAAIYMIPIDRYNKDYDMLNIGNLGKNGEDRIIDDIKNNDMIYLVINEKIKNNWQTPMKIVDYVKKNKNKLGEIEVYDIYF